MYGVNAVKDKKKLFMKIASSEMKQHDIQLLIDYLESKAKEREVPYEQRIKGPFWWFDSLNIPPDQLRERFIDILYHPLFIIDEEQKKS